MVFHSILFKESANGVRDETSTQPGCLSDLNLDQVIDAMTGNYAEYDLKPLFYQSLSGVDAINYRHEVMQDLENSIVFEQIQAFARNMRTMREYLAQADELHYQYQTERWFLDAVAVYCHAVTELAENLSSAAIRSRGLHAFQVDLADYLASGDFQSLAVETERLLSGLSAVRYCVLIDGDRFTVRKYQDEPDYSAEVEDAFRKFKQAAPQDYRATFSAPRMMNHVEEKILEFVTRLYPELFSALDTYCGRHSDYIHDTVETFDREIQFYFAYMEFIAPLRSAGLKFSYPRISHSEKEIRARETFDIALACRRVSESSGVVVNDFSLTGRERIFVVSGPNQGGKTTFARTFGQLHYLAGIGCPVPGRDTRLFLCDTLLTHFEKEESIQTRRGKLEDDLFRIHAVLDRATPNSVLILNEIFSSTTAVDALFLSREILQRVIRLNLMCVCVTFLDELASLSDTTVSMVGSIVPDKPAERTYKFERQPAEGRAYALSIAEKYRLTDQYLQQRIKA